MKTAINYYLHAMVMTSLLKQLLAPLYQSESAKLDKLGDFRGHDGIISKCISRAKRTVLLEIKLNFSKLSHILLTRYQNVKCHEATTPCLN